MNKALKVILGVVLAVVLVVALYVGYVMVSYYRLDDNLTLEADAPLGGTPPAAQINLAENPQLKVVTANLGFGAYNQDFDFFMDGGSGSVAAKAKYDAGQFDDAATCRDAGRPYDGTNDRWVMDTFIYSSNIECLDYSTVDLDFAYSDHNPAQMTFRLGE